MSKGADWAFSSPDADLLRANGITFGGRYVGPGTADKLLTRAEAITLNRAGIQCVSLVEGAARDALYGYGKGQEHGVLADRHLSSLGAPLDRPMYCAVDWDVTVDEMLRVRDYLDGVASVVGPRRVGAYGGLLAVRWLASNSPYRWLFQTYAWSHGQWYDGAQLRQEQNHVPLANGIVDLCESTTVDYGQWTLVEDRDMIFVRCSENGGYYSYPTPKWYTSEAAVDAALAAYGMGRSQIRPYATLDEIRGALGPIPGTDYPADAWGNPTTPAPSGGVDQAAIQASAGAGAAAAVRGVMAEPPQWVSDVANHVAVALGTLEASSAASVALSGHADTSTESAPTPA